MGSILMDQFTSNEPEFIQLNIIKDKIAEIETNKLVIISEFRSPIYLPRNPDIIAPKRGRKTKVYSIF